MPKAAHFSVDTFQFLAELAGNNDRGWFEDHRARYEQHVKKPLLAFITDFGPKLEKVSPHYIADPRKSGGSMFRIHRDVRFSKDKSPYKTHAAAQFRHQAGKDVHAPGFYLHLEPGNVFAGCGIWRPDNSSLKRIRAAIVERPEAWRAIVGKKAFEARFEMQGEALKRAPKGVDPEHPLIEDLKRKDFVLVERYSDKDACAPGFLDRFEKTCRAGSAYMGFLAGALDLPH